MMCRTYKYSWSCCRSEPVEHFYTLHKLSAGTLFKLQTHETEMPWTVGNVINARKCVEMPWSLRHCVRKRKCICEPVLLSYVATNSIRHLDWTLFVKIHHEDARFSIPHFGGSVLGEASSAQVRSRLYRRRLLRSNTLWKMFDEIYNFHILLVSLFFCWTNGRAWHPGRRLPGRPSRPPPVSQGKVRKRNKIWF